MSEASKLLSLLEETKSIWKQLPPELQAVYLRLAADCWDDIQARIGTAETGKPVQLSKLATPENINWAVGLIKRHWPGVTSGAVITAAIQFLSQYLTK